MKPEILSPSPSSSAPLVARAHYIAPDRQIWAWGLGGIANHILICTYGQATAIFTIGFSLNAALVSWPRIALIGSRTMPCADRRHRVR